MAASRTAGLDWTSGLRVAEHAGHLYPAAIGYPPGLSEV
jgi:hypothetical protein